MTQKIKHDLDTIKVNVHLDFKELADRAHEDLTNTARLQAGAILRAEPLPDGQSPTGWKRYVERVVHGCCGLWLRLNLQHQLTRKGPMYRGVAEIQILDGQLGTADSDTTFQLKLFKEKNDHHDKSS